jgi:hypothetical protein
MMYGNRRPMTEEQRRGMFAAKASGPNVVHSITTTPGGSTIQRTTETGFPRAPVQAGRVVGPPADQLRRPNPMEGIAPRRKGPEAPPAEHPGNPPPQGTIAYKQWLKDYGEWEKTLPGAGLRPWGSGGAADHAGHGRSAGPRGQRKSHGDESSQEGRRHQEERHPTRPRRRAG